MKYEYNSNLGFPERIAKVALEIKNSYPLISNEDSVKIAAISYPINKENPSNDDKFDRLYKIMLILGKDNPEYSHAFNDAFNLYDDGLTREDYKNVMAGIIDYTIGTRNTFPYLDEYM